MPFRADNADFKPWEITETTFHDAVSADGKKVRHSVVPIDQYGNRLTPDTGATVTDTTELDLRPTAPAATGAPLGHLGADRSGRLSWWLSVEEDGGKVSGYKNRRWNPQTRAFELIGTEPSGTGSTTWYDPGMPAATTVYYRVSVLYADGTESGQSEAVTVSY